MQTTMFDDVKVIMQEYGIPQNESETVRRMIDNYPEYVYRDWLQHLRELKPNKPGAYLNKCMKTYDRDGELVYDGPNSGYYGPKPKGRPKPGMNRWEKCSKCVKIKPCTYWEDPITDVKEDRRIYNWYCEDCYRILIDKADKIYMRIKQPQIVGAA